MSRSGRTPAIAVAVALWGWSCGSTSPEATPEVATIVVSPATSTIVLNGQLSLQAQVQDGVGATVPAAVTWTVEDPKILSVSPEGVVTALALGTSRVAANALGESGLATITVAQPPVARVDVTPATSSMQAGQTQQLVASPKDANGNAITGKTVDWASDNPAVAAVNGGQVTTSRPGSATITASVGSVRGTARISVSPGAVATVAVSAPSKNLKAGKTMQLTASAQDSRGNSVPSQSFTWSSSSTTTATVSSSGVVTGKRSGQVTITALSSGKSGSVQITVK
ncbi:MAG TPA: Ig-like domain-containing protein [Gemmatimonadaceae bacterium]